MGGFRDLLGLVLRWWSAPCTPGDIEAERIVVVPRLQSLVAVGESAIERRRKIDAGIEQEP
jgi:hypothetical protein